MTARVWCVAHTFVIFTRVFAAAFGSGGVAFLSRKAIRLSTPPSGLDAALLCFHPRTINCSKPPPRSLGCRIFAWELTLLERAF